MPSDVPVPVKRLPHFAGMDVLAAEDVTLAPGGRHAVATGLAVAIPPASRYRCARVPALR